MVQEGNEERALWKSFAAGLERRALGLGGKIVHRAGEVVCVAESAVSVQEGSRGGGLHRTRRFVEKNESGAAGIDDMHRAVNRKGDILKLRRARGEDREAEQNPIDAGSQRLKHEATMP